MKFNIFINFAGDCKEAVEFYAKVFKSEVKDLLTYAQVSSLNSEIEIQKDDLDRVMYAEILIGDLSVMFMDMPTDMPLTKGDNIHPTITLESKEELKRIFDKLKVNGQVYVEPEKTFFAELYCMVVDKFGITWQILCNE